MKIYEVVSPLDNTIEIIKKECSSFIANNLPTLKEHGYLFRGMKLDGDIEHVSVWTNRSPVGTSINWHNAADLYFQEAFGWPYRRASVFTTCNLSDAASYGNSYVVFPKGPYKICSSPIVYDFLLDVAIKTGNPIADVSAAIDTIPKDELSFIDGSIEEFRRIFLAFAQTHNRPDAEMKSKFKQMQLLLAKYVMPALQYEESLTYDHNVDIEYMVRCESYYAFNLDEYSDNSELTRLIQSI